MMRFIRWVGICVLLLASLVSWPVVSQENQLEPRLKVVKILSELTLTRMDKLIQLHREFTNEDPLFFPDSLIRRLLESGFTEPPVDDYSIAISFWYPLMFSFLGQLNVLSRLQEEVLNGLWQQMLDSFLLVRELVTGQEAKLCWGLYKFLIRDKMGNVLEERHNVLGPFVDKAIDYKDITLVEQFCL